jgi:hypothetical protein
MGESRQDIGQFYRRLHNIPEHICPKAVPRRSKSQATVTSSCINTTLDRRTDEDFAPSLYASLSENEDSDSPSSPVSVRRASIEAPVLLAPDSPNFRMDPTRGAAGMAPEIESYYESATWVFRQNTYPCLFWFSPVDCTEAKPDRMAFKEHFKRHLIGISEIEGEDLGRGRRLTCLYQISADEEDLCGVVSIGVKNYLDHICDHFDPAVAGHDQTPDVEPHKPHPGVYLVELCRNAKLIDEDGPEYQQLITDAKMLEAKTSGRSQTSCKSFFSLALIWLLISPLVVGA